MEVWAWHHTGGSHGCRFGDATSTWNRALCPTRRDPLPRPRAMDKYSPGSRAGIGRAGVRGEALLSGAERPPHGQKASLERRAGVQARLVPTRQGAPSGPECRPRWAQGSRAVASPLGVWPERSRLHRPIEGLRPATSRPGLLLQGPALEPRGDFPLAPLGSWGGPGLKPIWLLRDGGALITPCGGSWRLPCCSPGAPLSSTSLWRALSAGKAFPGGSCPVLGPNAL